MYTLQIWLQISWQGVHGMTQTNILALFPTSTVCERMCVCIWYVCVCVCVYIYIYIYIYIYAHAWSCPTLCDPVHCGPPGSSSRRFMRQEYCSGLPFPSPGDLPHPGIELRSPALQADSLPLSHLGSPMHIYISNKILVHINYQVNIYAYVCSVIFDSL